MSEKVATSTPIAVSIFLAATTAGLTYYGTSQVERDKALTDQKKEAYVGFVSALDKDRASQQPSRCNLETDKLCQLQLEFQVQGGAALKRIAIYGDAEVVRAVAEYSRAIGRHTSRCADTWPLDLKMFSSMRISILGQQEVSDQDLAELALPCSIGSPTPHANSASSPSGAQPASSGR